MNLTDLSKTDLLHVIQLKLCRDLSEISDYCTETNFLITIDHNSLRKTGVLMLNLKWDVPGT